MESEHVIQEEHFENKAATPDIVTVPSDTLASLITECCEGEILEKQQIDSTPWNFLQNMKRFQNADIFETDSKVPFKRTNNYRSMPPISVKLRNIGQEKPNIISNQVVEKESNEVDTSPWQFTQIRDRFKQLTSSTTPSSSQNKVIRPIKKLPNTSQTADCAEEQRALIEELQDRIMGSSHIFNSEPNKLHDSDEKRELMQQEYEISEAISIVSSLGNPEERKDMTEDMYISSTEQQKTLEILEADPICGSENELTTTAEETSNLSPQMDEAKFIASPDSCLNGSNDSNNLQLSDVKHILEKDACQLPSVYDNISNRIKEQNGENNSSFVDTTPWHFSQIRERFKEFTTSSSDKNPKIQPVRKLLKAEQGIQEHNILHAETIENGSSTSLIVSSNNNLHDDDSSSPVDVQEIKESQLVTQLENCLALQTSHTSDLQKNDSSNEMQLKNLIISPNVHVCGDAEDDGCTSPNGNSTDDNAVLNGNSTDDNAVLNENSTDDNDVLNGNPTEDDDVYSSLNGKNYLLDEKFPEREDSGSKEQLYIQYPPLFIPSTDISNVSTELPTEEESQMSNKKLVLSPLIIPDNLDNLLINDHLQAINNSSGSQFQESVVSTNLSPLQTKFLSTSVGCNFIKNEIDLRNLMFNFDINVAQQLLTIIAPTNSLGEEYSSFILDLMKSFDIPLDEAKKLAWKENGLLLQRMVDVKDIGEYFCYNLEDGSDILTVLAASTEIEHIKQELETFFVENVVCDFTIVDDEYFLKYWKKFHHADFVAKWFGKVLFDDSYQEKVIVSGIKSHIERLKLDVASVLSSLETNLYKSQIRGIINYFQTYVGCSEIKEIADNTQTIIEIVDLGSKCGSKLEGINLEGFLNEKLKILVVHGDITCQNVDAIVNVVNGGPLTTSILRAGGKIMKNDINSYIKSSEHLNDQVYVSKAGNLQCKDVIHVVGTWNTAMDGKSNKFAELHDVVMLCINAAESKNHKSVAFTAFSRKTFGCAIDTVVEIIVHAIVNSCDKLVNVKEIRIVDIDQNAVLLLANKLNNMTEFKKISDISLSLNAVSIATSTTSTMQQLTNEIKMSFNGCKIELVKDDIVNVAKNCDIIVNTTSASDLLGGGYSCQAITKAAGTAFINEIKQQHPSGLDGATIAVTSAGQLGCLHVYHIACPVWDDNSGITAITDRINACLNQADSDGLSSIAFPAIGTGGLKYPPTVISKTTIDTTMKWLTGNLKTSLKKVFFVVYPSNTEVVKAFEQEISLKILQEKSNIAHPLKSATTSVISRALNWVLKNLKTSGSTEVQRNEQNLILNITGSKPAILEAWALLDKVCDEKSPEKFITKDIISTFDQAAIFRLHILSEEYEVEIAIDIDEKRIKIRGFRAVEFQNVLSDILDRIKDEIFDVGVNWYVRNETSTWSLIAIGVSRLEKAFQTCSGKGCIEFEFSENNGLVTIDFDKMVVLSERKEILYNLKRRENADIPVEWDWDGKIVLDYQLIILDPMSPEYATVSNDISQTVKNVNIQKIERVENPVKYQQYMTLKHRVQQNLKPGFVMEKFLFHGTAEENIPDICNDGFNRSLCGQNGTMYGNGCYFARDFSYSSHYGTSTVFYVRVLTGNFTKGVKGMKVAPFLDHVALSKRTRFDSVVDNLDDPTMHVVFTDNHAYPAYLITYNKNC